ncbi:putative oxidoreductase [Pseudomonas aeruginosa]|nr:putative oxidoreductase [Pseudomonas aeruginosa]EFQ40678.1 LOW QUALITY PROTEIN: putative oxidoreductase [Pseudomonas aeruginosa 39016]BAK92210.1 putative oxidoreductase [Pseudomonas aeruginosa NCGM2.S1]AVK11398.1 putative oxidoreductase [Pseudomonas aeruginosa]AWF61858.1 putative oxidoreductase [Pseudomonas aeruginosa]
MGRLRPPRRAEVVPAAGTVVGREVGYFRHRRDLTLVIGTR